MISDFLSHSVFCFGGQFRASVGWYRTEIFSGVFRCRSSIIAAGKLVITVKWINFRRNCTVTSHLRFNRLSPINWSMECMLKNILKQTHCSWIRRCSHNSQYSRHIFDKIGYIERRWRTWTGLAHTLWNDLMAQTNYAWIQTHRSDCAKNLCNVM